MFFLLLFSSTETFGLWKVLFTYFSSGSTDQHKTLHSWLLWVFLHHWCRISQSKITNPDYRQIITSDPKWQKCRVVSFAAYLTDSREMKLQTKHVNHAFFTNPTVTVMDGQQARGPTGGTDRWTGEISRSERLPGEQQGPWEPTLLRTANSWWRKTIEIEISHSVSPSKLASSTASSILPNVIKIQTKTRVRNSVVSHFPGKPIVGWAEVTLVILLFCIF